MRSVEMSFPFKNQGRHDTAQHTTSRIVRASYNRTENGGTKNYRLEQNVLSNHDKGVSKNMPKNVIIIISRIHDSRVELPPPRHDRMPSDNGLEVKGGRQKGSMVEKSEFPVITKCAFFYTQI